MGFEVDKVALEQAPLQVLQVFPANYHSTNVPHSSTWQASIIGPFETSISRDSVPNHSQPQKKQNKEPYIPFCRVSGKIWSSSFSFPLQWNTNKGFRNIHRNVITTSLQHKEMPWIRMKSPKICDKINISASQIIEAIPLILPKGLYRLPWNLVCIPCHLRPFYSILRPTLKSLKLLR